MQGYVQLHKHTVLEEPDLTFNQVYLGSPKYPQLDASTVSFHRGNSYQTHRSKGYDHEAFPTCSQQEARRGDIDAMKEEHRVETQNLLVQINRLHEFLEEVYKKKQEELQEFKQKSDHHNQLQLLNLKQGGVKEKAIYEMEIRKYKELLKEKVVECELVNKSAERDREISQREMERVRIQLKEIIEKKNDQIFDLEKKNINEELVIRKQCEDKIAEISQQFRCEKLKSRKQLQQYQDQCQKLKDMAQKALQKQQQVLRDSEQCRVSFEQALNRKLQQDSQRTSFSKKKLEESYLSEIAVLEERIVLQKAIYDSQYQLLKQKITVYEKELAHHRAKDIQFYSQSEIDAGDGSEPTFTAIVYDQLRYAAKKNEQMSEVFKAKIAVLHEHDLKELVWFYQNRLVQQCNRVSRCEAKIQTYHKQLEQERVNLQAYKKNAEMELSSLRVAISKLTLQQSKQQQLWRNKQFLSLKQLQQIQELYAKSIRQKEEKLHFCEEELRKLRDIVRQKNEQIDSNQQINKLKIERGEAQLQRMVKEMKNNQNEYEVAISSIKMDLQSKNKEIMKLNQIVQQSINTLPESQQIPHIAASLQKVTDDLRDSFQHQKLLGQKCQQLESEILALRDQLQTNRKEHLETLNHVTNSLQQLHQQKLANEKQFHERIIRKLQSDQAELRAANTLLRSQLSDLVVRYKEVQSALQVTADLALIRTDLQRRILHLGTDNNLVKNLSQLFISD